jgi:methyl-accepting chemotaxis protein
MGFGAIAVIALMLGAVGYYGAVQSDGAIAEIGTVRLPSVQGLLVMSEAQTAIDSAENALLSTRLDAKMREAQYQRINAAKQRADEGWKLYEPLPQTVEEAAVWKQFVPAWNRWQRDHEDYLKLVRTFEASGIANLEANRTSPAYEQMNHQALVTNGESFAVAETLLNKLVAINLQVAHDATHDAVQDARLMKAFNLGATGAGAFLALLLAWLMTRIIQRPIGGEPAEMALITQQIAAGDLTIRFSQTGQETGIYAAMREMTAQLKGIVGHVIQSTNHVNSAAAEMAQGSTDLAQRTEEQAASLEEIASSMEELTSTVQQSADNADQANQLASAARTQAEQGGQVAEQAIVAMGAINASSRRIADVISVIDEMAFQTNLLALNAAVEAARAGEQGRGFAVVAGEVRKLAQRSADAAKEIKGLIADSMSKVEDGGRLVQQSGQMLGEIATAAKKVNDIVAEMAAAAREQASGIQQANQAILQMDQVTQENAALVEETAAASHTMSDQAYELHQLMSFFTLDDRGASIAPVATARKPVLAVVASRTAVPTQRRLPTHPSRPGRLTLGKRTTRSIPATADWTPRPVAAGNNGQEWEEF